MAGKPWTPERRTARSAGLLNHHHGSYTWLLFDPDGKPERTTNMKAFCAERGLAYGTMKRKAYQYDARSILRGPSKGWSVFSVIKPGDRQRSDVKSNIPIINVSDEPVDSLGANPVPADIL